MATADDNESREGDVARSQSFARIDPTEWLIGESPAIRALRAQIRHLAPFDAPGHPFVPPLLLQGETGTGKDLLAHISHDSSPRAKGPFLEVNCAAIPETLLEAELFGFEPGAFTDARRAKPGLFEAASGGTLFLDEIDALPLTLQSKLLTVIESKRVRRLGAVADRAVDVKLIAATPAELGGRVTAGRFRADLYHRLAVVVLHLPALRERGADVLVLARHFLARYAEGHGLAARSLTRDAAAWLTGYAWPGNVRELAHLMERVVLLHEGGEVDAATLERLCLSQPTPGGPAETTPREGPAAPPEPESVEEPARIRAVLARTGGNVVAAARLLGLSRNALRYRMFRYGIGRHEKVEASLLHAKPMESDPLPRESPHRGAADGEPLAQAPSWEQKPVAVLAIDMAFPKAMGPEAARCEPWTVVTRWVQTITERVQRFGGVLVHHAPSLLTIVFGVPRALEQLPHRTVQAAVAIQRAVAKASPSAKGEPVPEVRLAVHLGAALVDARAGEPAPRLLAVGDTLALPVRLLGHARPGEILVSSRVGRLIDGGFDLEARDLPLPDKQADRTSAYAVAGFRAACTLLEEAATRLHIRLVGRDRELAALHELLTQVESGHGQVVGILGEPGMGKSRLLREFRQTLEPRGVLALEGRCLAYGSAVPYLPVLDLVRQQCGITEADGGEALTEKVQSALRAARREPGEGTRYLLRLLGAPAEAEPLEVLSAEAIKARTFDALRQLTLQACRARPLVVIIEDLHWIDQTSEEYLTSLVERLANTSILLLTTYRPGYRPPWMVKSFATQLALRPLSPAESLRVVQSILQPAALPDTLVKLILDKAEGNPFFLEELARVTREQEPVDLTVAVPETIQELLLARIDRLPDAPRRLLQIAAVLGREVSLKLLRETWREPGDLVGHLQMLTRLEFFAEQSGENGPTYLFKHALIQEVAYQTVPAVERQALHAAAGRALEALYADRLEGISDQLAYHYARTTETEKSIMYLTGAGEKAARGFAHAEAVSAFEEAIRHVERLPAAERERHRVSLLLKLAYSVFFLGRAEEALGRLLRERECVERLQEPSLAGPYYFMLSCGCSFLGEHEQAVLHATRTVAEATRCGDDASLGKAYQTFALEAYWAGQPHQGVEHARQAVACLERTVERYWLGQAHRSLGLNYALLGEFDLALEATARAYAIGEAIGDSQLQSHVLWAIGWIEATRGEWTTGIAACQRGVKSGPDPGSTAFTLGHLGAAYLEQGEPAQAMSSLEQAIQRAQEFGFRRAQGWFTTLLAEAHRLDGHLEQARELARLGLQIARNASCRPAIGWAQRALGRSAQASGAGSEAERYLNEALETFAAIGARFEVGRTHLALADLARSEGNRRAAAAHIAKARQVFQVLRVPRYVERADRLGKTL